MTIRSLAALGQASASELKALQKQIGMVFQHFNLLDSKTVFENVALPLRLNKVGNQEVEERVSALLDYVGLADKAQMRPHQLSGGQKQRTAIGVAALRDAEVLIFDEPTSGLDYKNMESVAEILSALSKRGKAILVISHDNELLMKICSRVIRMDEKTSS